MSAEKREIESPTGQEGDSAKRAKTAGVKACMPYVISRSCREHVAWIESTLGGVVSPFSETHEEPKLVMHVCVTFGNTMMFFCDNMDNTGKKDSDDLKAVPRAFSMHLSCEDADAVHAKAVAAGAKNTMAMEDTFWGMRYGRFEDPFGLEWAVGHDLPKKE